MGPICGCRRKAHEQEEGHADLPALLQSGGPGQS
jgi:hypothetical protein